MRIAVFFEHHITGGGNFFQALTNLKQIDRIASAKGYEVLVYCTVPESVEELGKHGLKASFASLSRADRWVRPFVSGTLRRIFKSDFWQLTSLEQTLIRDRVDIIYFISQSSLAARIQRLNFIYTIFDLCHKDFPEFPETRFSDEFHKRERLFLDVIQRSAFTVVNSASLKTRVSSLYRIEEARIVNMPFSPSLQVTNSGKDNTMPERLLQLLPERFIFYPAQFWAHKNHIRILEALRLLKEQGTKQNVVFTGTDKGNYRNIAKFAAQHDLTDQVINLGFVSDKELNHLYHVADALIMPTYFGPTNLPPLEAWFHGCPVIYSGIFREEVEGAAILVDPDDAVSVAEGILSLSVPGTKETLVRNGYEKLDKIKTAIGHAEEELIGHFEKFIKRSANWI